MNGRNINIWGGGGYGADVRTKRDQFQFLRPISFLRKIRITVYSDNVTSPSRSASAGLQASKDKKIYHERNGYTIYYKLFAIRNTHTQQTLL